MTAPSPEAAASAPEESADLTVKVVGTLGHKPAPGGPPVSETPLFKRAAELFGRKIGDESR